MSVKICYLNENFTENVDKNMFTKQLKENVAKTLKLDSEDLELKIDQIFLQDEKYIRKVLETNFILTCKNETIPIKINDLTFIMDVIRSNGRQLEIKNLTGEITIEELKKRLSLQLNFDAKDMILKQGIENILEDNKSLKDYISVKTLDVVVKNKTKVRILIKYGDRKHYVNAFKEMTGEEFRKEISKKIKMSIVNYNLDYNGKVIQLSDKLEDHDIVDDAVIMAVAEVDGGDN